MTSALTEDVAEDVDLPPLSSLWEDTKIQKSNDRGNKEWRCGWCGSGIKHWNAKKALHHVAKVLKGVYVARCKAYIPEKRLERLPGPSPGEAGQEAGCQEEGC